MTTQERERLEIVKEVCSLQDCSLQEIYDFIMTGNTSGSVKLDTTPADGVYIVTQDGRIYKFAGNTNLIFDRYNPVVGIGVKQGNRSAIISLKDAADGEDVTLTDHEDNTGYDGYLLSFEDAVADWRGAANTAHLRQIGLNPAITLQAGEYIPSAGEMYLVYTHLREVNAALRLVGGLEIPAEWHWVSTEPSPLRARLLNLLDGTLYWGVKTNARAFVRPAISTNVFNSNR